jgi:hypothetical protein
VFKKLREARSYALSYLQQVVVPSDGYPLGLHGYRGARSAFLCTWASATANRSCCDSGVTILGTKVQVLCYVLLYTQHFPMPLTTTLLVLIAYPVLLNLPYNLIRFRWGFSRGLARMPPDVEERAQAADRAADLIFDLLLVTVVLSLLRDSSISSRAAGLTLDNWKHAIALGAAWSFVPLLLFFLFVARSKPQDEPQSRGPLPVWCGLVLLGGFSTELWRAVCIAALIHLDFPTWIAVSIASIAYGASQVTKSKATIAGAASFGVIAGLLFVSTSSLLAPLTTSLIAEGANLYRARGLSSKARQRQGSFNVRCPVCGTDFDRRSVQDFTCPGCDEQLAYETETKFDYVWLALSLYGCPFLLYLLGVRSFFALIGLPIGMYLVGMIINVRLFPRQVVQKYGALRLRDWTNSGGKHPPS